MLGLGSILQLCKTEHLENRGFRAVLRHTQSYYHSHLQWHWSALRLIRFSPSSCTISFYFLKDRWDVWKFAPHSPSLNSFRTGRSSHQPLQCTCIQKCCAVCGGIGIAPKTNSFKNIIVQKLEKSCDENTQRQQLDWRQLDVAVIWISAQLHVNSNNNQSY